MATEQQAEAAVTALREHDATATLPAEARQVDGDWCIAVHPHPDHALQMAGWIEGVRVVVEPDEGSPWAPDPARGTPAAASGA